ncbi:excitatory amino acid transporter 3-like isoform X2 [Xiphophorus couchianus]|uniref:excitatory amino acid transporter 3-like isoform X2 n=1 Tax=Xiphophorus couchianus TaxID=32473 RepID=UPI001015EB84|nr:excitatory amino acid transporter 3-like isoform X2 [Xiphophorus couchianus]
MIILKESLFQGFTLMMIALGLGIGFLLRLMVSVTQDQMDWIKFPGDLFFNLLQLFAVPLIVTSVMAEVSGLNSRLPGRSAVFLTTYICGSTVLAVTLGMSLVLLVKPGMDHTTGKTTVNINMPSSSMHVIFMDLIRNVVPESFVQAFYEHYKTEIVQVKTNIPRHYLDPVMAQNGTETRLMGNYVPGANMVGLIASSFTIGIMLNKAGLKAKATVKFIKCLSIALKIIFNWILWYLPIGLLFLVVEYVLDVSDWTVIIKLIRLTGVIFLGFPRLCSPQRSWRPGCAFCQSAATLPVTIQCCEANVKVNTKLCRLMLPMVSSINMNGMALYEVVAVLFIAQISDILLDVTQIITICLTCCISSFGAVGVPATGSATTILILTAVGLPAHNASLLLVFEWFLDHFTTIVNVLGDCFGVALINHLCQDEIVILDKSSREGMRSTRELELDLFCLEPEEEFIPSSSSGSILSM